MICSLTPLKITAQVSPGAQQLPPQQLFLQSGQVATHVPFEQVWSEEQHIPPQKLSQLQVFVELLQE